MEWEVARPPSNCTDSTCQDSEDSSPSSCGPPEGVRLSRLTLSGRRWGMVRRMRTSSPSGVSPAASSPYSQGRIRQAPSRRWQWLSHPTTTSPDEAFSSISGFEKVSMLLPGSAIVDSSTCDGKEKFSQLDSDGPLQSSARSNGGLRWEPPTRRGDLRRGSSSPKRASEAWKISLCLVQVLVLVSMSLLTIVGAKMLVGGVGTMAREVKMPKAVVDEFFDRADKDHDGFIESEEIQDLVTGTGGAGLDEASEIAAGVESVFKHLDLNEDKTLSRSDLLSYWTRLGSLLTVDEVAEWVVHSVQLPQEVAEVMRSNVVTGYDFPELVANQGHLLEQDLGIKHPAYRKRLVRGMKWKLWGMGEEPLAPTQVRATNSSCGSVSIEWQCGEGDQDGFPVHKYVLKRAWGGNQQGPRWAASESNREHGGHSKQWIKVMDGPNRSFLDTRLEPGGGYTYSLQAWNAMGHSKAVEFKVLVGRGDCGSRGMDSEGLIHWQVVVAVTMAILSVIVVWRLARRGEVHNVGARNGNGARIGLDGVTHRQSKLELTTVHPLNQLGARERSLSTSPKLGMGTPRKGFSGGSLGTKSDREKMDSVRKTSSAALPMRRRTPVMVSLKKAKGIGTVRVGGEDGGAGDDDATRGKVIGGGVSRDSRIDAQKDRARRLQSYHSSSSSSQEDKDACKVCHKEFKWYHKAKHACCKCHGHFCDGCGMSCHSFGVCPVGASCICNSCLDNRKNW